VEHGRRRGRFQRGLRLELPNGFVPTYASLLEQIRLQHPDAAIAERAAAGDARVTGADIELDELVD